MNPYSHTVKTLKKLKGSASAEPLISSAALTLRGGRVIDPRNKIDRIADISMRDGHIVSIPAATASRETGRVIDCSGLVVLPGLFDMHLHLGDLFDVYESPALKAARDGVTLGLSPGAGNTFMAPSLLGAEVDRGLPLNVGVYLGAAAVLGCGLSTAELVALFAVELDDATLSQKLSRNAITNSTAHLTVGLKDHMGHFILSDAAVDALYEVTSQAGLVLMSHTQDPEHAVRMAQLSKGRPLHLAHATAAGGGTHGDGAQAMRKILSLVDGENITAEFVSSMLLESRGRRDGLKMQKPAQELAYQALKAGTVDIIVSDGQSGATMKGFGNTADNVPCLFTLERLGVLLLSEAVACMTCNPALFLTRRTGNPFFESHLGHLGEGALANITVADPQTQAVVHTIVNGTPVAFEGNLLRDGLAAGCLVSRQGFSRRTGVGDLTLYD